MSDGYRKQGSLRLSFMYSLGVYVVPVDEEDEKHKYFCLTDLTCSGNKKTVSCKQGNRSNENTDRKTKNTSWLCSARRVHTKPYPGYLPGYYPTINF